MCAGSLQALVVGAMTLAVHSDELEMAPTLPRSPAASLVQSRHADPSRERFPSDAVPVQASSKLKRTLPSAVTLGNHLGPSTGEALGNASVPSTWNHGPTAATWSLAATVEVESHARKVPESRASPASRLQMASPPPSPSAAPPSAFRLPVNCLVVTNMRFRPGVTLASPGPASLAASPTRPASASTEPPPSARRPRSSGTRQPQQRSAMAMV